MRRWVDTGKQAKAVLTQAATITVVHDREGDIYASWATLPGENVHVLARAMHDRAVAGGGTLSGALAKLDFVSTRTVESLATPKREARQAVLSLRFGSVEVLRPDGPDARDLPKTLSLRIVEAIERNPPAGVEPVHWRCHQPRRRRHGGGLANRRLVPASLDDRAIVPPDEDARLAARGQPTHHRRGPDQTRRYCRQGRGGDPAARCRRATARAASRPKLPSASVRSSIGRRPRDPLAPLAGRGPG